ELLFALLEVFVEVGLELGGEAIFDVLGRAILGAFGPSESRHPVLAFIGYFLLGCSAGGFSVILFRHPLVRPSRFHGLSIVVSPLATGLIMSLVGAALRRRNITVTRIESFAYGFAFALGMAVVRFHFVG